MSQPKITSIDRSETARKNIESVRRQIRAMDVTGPMTIECPYCQEVTDPGGTFCCKRLIQAVAAVIDRVNVDDAIELVERIQEGRYQQSKVTLN